MISAAQSSFVIPFSQPDPVPIPSICLVTVSSDNKNTVVWEKQDFPFTAGYKIYRESLTQTGKWDLAGTVGYSAISTFSDPAADPSLHSYRYRISAIDDCGAETNMSSGHKTIRLALNTGTDGSYNLSWDKYEGFSVSSYAVYRGFSPDEMSVIATTTSANLSYTDPTVPAGIIYYQVEVLSPQTCSPSGELTSTDYISSRSNIVSNIPDGGSLIIADSRELSVFPNPCTSGSVTISVQNPGSVLYKISLLEPTGKVVAEAEMINGSIEIPLAGLSDGLYVICAQGTTVHRKLLVVNKIK